MAQSSPARHRLGFLGRRRMRMKHWWYVPLALVTLAVGVWVTNPPALRANGEDKHEIEEVGHAHVPAPLEYADLLMPPSVWTDQAMSPRGKEIYAANCAVCHGEHGDGKGPAGQALPLKPSDFRDRHAVAEMRDNYWFWRASEGGTVEPFKSRGSGMPPWKGTLSVEDRWAVIAYQHTFSGHQGPHVPWEHPEMVQMGRDIYRMACVSCHGLDGQGDGSVGPTLSPNRAPQPRDFTAGLFKLRSTPTGELPTTADPFRPPRRKPPNGSRGVDNSMLTRSAGPATAGVGGGMARLHPRSRIRTTSRSQQRTSRSPLASKTGRRP